MTTSYTTTAAFTRTHAKHLAAKVVADLHQCGLLYGEPTMGQITNYETELVELLAGEYVAEYEFGFKKDGIRTVSWRYTVGPSGNLDGDSNTGALYARAALNGAHYYNFLTPSAKWSNLDSATRSEIVSKLPFVRGEGFLPGDGAGYWHHDHCYTAGGTRIIRKTFRPW